MKILTTSELARATAGGDDYIRTKGNVVKGVALRRDLNPDAPDKIVFGKGPRIEARAQRFLDSGVVVPAYIKLGTNAWEYRGHYRATAIRRDSAIIRRYGSRRRNVAGILFLRKGRRFA